MAETKNHDAKTEVQNAVDYYLPATAGLSSEPGPGERLLKAVFGRRGEIHVSVSRRSR